MKVKRTKKLRRIYENLAYRVYGLKKICDICGKTECTICIHHKDSNIENNEIDNLQILCNSCHTRLHKKGYKFKLGRTCSQEAKERMRKNSISGKKVNQYSLDGEFIKTWKSIKSVIRELGIHRQGILLCCKGEKNRKTAGGFKWKYN